MFDFLIFAVNFLNAWDIKRAWRPICESPISPSISALGVRAATESITSVDIAPERTRVSAISKACSPESGWDKRSSSILTPKFSAYFGSNACSASINAAVPPSFCAWAITWRAIVVFPDDSGPYISTTRPLGKPPIPRAVSRVNDPVDMDSMSG